MGPWSNALRYAHATSRSPDDAAVIRVDDTTHVSFSEAETEDLAARLAAGLVGGEVIALEGPLGAGKTCFVRGLVGALGGSRADVHSPTFVLHHVYRGGRMAVHHIDCYRLGLGADLRELDLDTLTEEGVVVVEWADLADLAGYAVTRLSLEIPDASCRRLRLDEASPGVRDTWLGGGGDSRR